MRRDGVMAGGATLDATFVRHAGNEWWIEMKVLADAPIVGVSVAVGGGPPIPMEPTAWDTWAVSTHAPAGTSVAFTATSHDGREATSGAMVW